MRRIFSVVVLLFIGSIEVFGQASKTPFTYQGIGEIHDFSMIHNDGMGGLGISQGSPMYMNAINPALLTYNTLTVFQAGFITEKRSVFANNASSVNHGGNLAYLATVFPVKAGRWTSGIGLSPYSTVEYESISRTSYEGSSGIEAITAIGKGGINQLYWANGIKINKHFNVGLRVHYLFSSIDKEVTTIVTDTTFLQGYQANLKDKLSVSDIKFSFGAAYVKDSIFNNQINFNVGITYDLGANVNATQTQTLERRDMAGSPFEADTLFHDRKGEIKLPSSFGFGVSLSQKYMWMVGVEMKLQNWSGYEDIDGSNDGMADAMEMTVGGQFTPDYASVSSYLKRITYRTGFNYALLPYKVNNNQVKEFGINFGLSLPVGRFSSIDLSMNYGKRGNIGETTIEEEVLRFGLGITFNDQWFIRRKYD